MNTYGTTLTPMLKITFVMKTLYMWKSMEEDFWSQFLKLKLLRFELIK